MALFRPRRNRRGPDRFLTLKMVLFAFAGLTAFTGIALDIRWLLNPAIAILVGALALNLQGKRREPPESRENSSAD